MLPSGTSPLGRLGHASTVVEDEMIIHGGKGIGGSRLATFNDTWRYNPLSRTWNELIYSTRHEVNPVGRRGHILEYIPVLNALYIFGGVTGREDSRNGCITDFGRLLVFESGKLGLASCASLRNGPLGTILWRKCFIPPARLDVDLRGRWMSGSCYGESTLDDLWSYSIAANSWNQIQAANAPAARSHAAMVYSELLDQLFIHGGALSDGRSAATYQFSLGLGQWSAVHDGQYDAPSARSLHHMVLLPPGSLAIFGGVDDSEVKQDTWLMDLPRRDLCSAGQIYNGTGCKDCAAGFYDATPEIDVDECLECPNDAASDPGSAACLPLVAPWVQQQVPPSVTVVRNFAGKIEVVAQAAVLPNQFYSTPAVPSYSIDIAPTKESLQPRSACSVLWQPQAAQNSELTEMVAELTYPDLDDKCQLNEKQVGDLIHRDGFLGVYVLLTGTVESTIAFFAFPLELKFIRTAEGIYTGYVAAGSHHIDQQVFLLGSCHSTVNFFRTENFEQPLEPAVYVVGDVVYAEHTLETDHLTLEVVQVWISSSKNPDDWDALSENLTDAMVLLTGQGSQGKARFTFQARPQSCQLCFVHVLSRVTQTSGRRFSMQQMHALKFSPIVIQPKEEGLPFIMSIEQSLAIAVTVALAGFLLALVCKFKCAHGKDQWKCGCVPVFLMVESFDCFLDVAAWIGASLTGDLTFSDDGGFVGNTLLASTVGSCVLFGGVLVLLRVC